MTIVVIANLNKMEKVKALELVKDLRNSAEQLLIDGYGQCNTKATLLMALLRDVNIPCLIHGFEVSKDFQNISVD